MNKELFESVLSWLFLHRTKENIPQIQAIKVSLDVGFYLFWGLKFLCSDERIQSSALVTSGFWYAASFIDKVRNAPLDTIRPVSRVN